jgi:hypothetical protein
LVVKPSRCEWPTAKPIAAFLPSGPDALARDVDRAEVAERDDGGAGPLGQGRRARADVNQPPERVPAEQRALRAAHELDLAQIEELDAGGNSR